MARFDGRDDAHGLADESVGVRRQIAAPELRASLEKNKRLRDLERGLTEDKVFAFLLSQSTVES